MVGVDWNGEGEARIAEGSGSFWPNGSSDSLGLRMSLRCNGKAGLVWAAIVWLRERVPPLRLSPRSLAADIGGFPIVMAGAVPVGLDSDSGSEPSSSSSLSSPGFDAVRTMPSGFSRLLRSSPRSSSLPCSMATSPIICVKGGIPGTPAKIMPMPTRAGCTFGLIFLRIKPGRVRRLSDVYGVPDAGRSP